MNLKVPAIFISSIVVAALTHVPSASGQAPEQTARQGIVAARGAFFALSVADLEASSRWYAEKLGLEVLMHVPKANGVAVTVLEGGGLIVELIQIDGAVAPACGATNPALCLGQFKAGVIVKDLDKTLEKLAARAVTVAFGPFPEQPNQPANAIIRDNAGNLIQIIEE